MLSTSYDATADALYVRLSYEPVARTEELDDWTLVDVDKSGAPVGVEVIHPARQWPAVEFCERYHLSGEDRTMFEVMFLGGRVAFPAPDQEASGTRALAAV